MKFKNILATFAILIIAVPALAQEPEHAHASAPAAHAQGGHAAPASGLSPMDALKLLKDGQTRFLQNNTSMNHKAPEYRKSLVGGQKPHTIVLSCSDSRVPPELLFDQGFGDLFIVRVAGNVLGAAQVASIEYAVEHLGSPLILVLGHESCGAVKAALATPPNKSAGSPDLDTLVSTLQPSFEKLDRKDLSTDKNFKKPAIMNVDMQADRLPVRSTLVRKAIEEGKLSIVRGLYSLETGKVEFWGGPGSGLR